MLRLGDIMCKITMTDEWRTFFNSIQKEDFKIIYKDAADIHNDCIVIRRDQFEDICRRSRITLNWHMPDRCLIDEEADVPTAPIVYQ